MLHVYGKYVVRGSQWVGRGSNAGGLGMTCKWAGAVMLRNHNFGQFCIIVNFPIMNHSKRCNLTCDFHLGYDAPRNLR